MDILNLYTCYDCGIKMVLVKSSKYKFIVDSDKPADWWYCHECAYKINGAYSERCFLDLDEYLQKQSIEAWK